jgi:hypothetical protein
VVTSSLRELSSACRPSRAFEWRANAGRWRWLILGALGAAPNACGGRTDALATDTSGDDLQGQGSRGQVKAGTGGTAGQRNPPLTTGGSLGDPAPHTTLPADGPSATACVGETALGGGWLRCDNGLLHRPVAGACTSIVPRSEPTSVPAGYGDAGAYLGCRQDRDCRDAPYGHCEVSFQEVVGTYCEYGCTVDADCSGGQVCLCGDAVGACVNAQCSTDGECGAGQLCADYIENPGCGGTAFACQTLADECAAQSDCSNDEPFCGVEDNGSGAKRVCMNAVCAIGRPFLIDGNERLAPPLARADWYTAADAADRCRSGLDATLRTELARHWTEQALMEHASVAAFARFTLQLLSLGAPAALVQRAGDAMQDELRHARACFELARSYSASDVGPGPLPLDGALADSSLQSIVVNTVLEGCIGETVAALEAAEALAHCEDDQARAVLERITAEESQHAELAWAFVEWALATGPRELEGQVRGAFAAALGAERSPHLPPSVFDRELLRQGVVSPELRRALRARVLDEVIEPCARALLERPRATSGQPMARAHADAPSLSV